MNSIPSIPCIFACQEYDALWSMFYTNITDNSIRFYGTVKNIKLVIASAREITELHEYMADCTELLIKPKDNQEYNPIDFTDDHAAVQAILTYS